MRPLDESLAAGGQARRIMIEPDDFRRAAEYLQEQANDHGEYIGMCTAIEQSFAIRGKSPEDNGHAISLLRDYFQPEFEKKVNYLLHWTFLSSENVEQRMLTLAMLADIMEAENDN